MGGHHLVLGELRDYLTGEVLEDTLDERYRQDIARFLVERKGYAKEEITPRYELLVRAGEKRAVVKIDFVVRIGDKIGMIIKFGPGSMITRYRPTLAASRVVADYQVPLAVVSNGQAMDVLSGVTNKPVAMGVYDALPSRDELAKIVKKFKFPKISEKRREMEERIVYAYEVDGSCPCDDTVCRL